jgi:hypothetical protein
MQARIISFLAAMEDDAPSVKGAEAEELLQRLQIGKLEPPWA